MLPADFWQTAAFWGFGGEKSTQNGYFVYSFASLAAGMRFNGQKDQANHSGKRLRGKFNGNFVRGAIKSGPYGQNLQLCNAKQREKIFF
ncbi:hypothetical protein [Enterobacter mori]|uniref:hypothetical protein n=1 Tax=Enterobacter mori TaxID=539813 RepID=UPI0029318F7A|nr:hypothetical protein [Enterobacter mori]